MILDTSAILAVLFDEPEREEFLQKIGDAEQVGIGAPTLVEAGVVLCGSGSTHGGALVGEFVVRTGAVVIAFEGVHWTSALDAWLRYGRGRHPAGLNFGDCLAYATAAIAEQALLCKGSDFAQTDLALA